MKISFQFFVLLLFLSNSSFCQSDSLGMTNEKIEQIINKIGDNVEGELGNWQVIYGEQILYIITDKTFNRMRIFTPIIEQKELKKGQLREMLAANFHAALDAKYALYSGYVVALFTHPLKELDTNQFKDAVKQVAVASQNFGTSYSSTDLIFGGKGNDDKQNSEKDKKLNQKPKKKT